MRRSSPARRLFLAALVAFTGEALTGAVPAGSQAPAGGTTAATADPCAAIGRLYAASNGETPFRPLPVLLPAEDGGQGVLRMRIVAARPSAGPLAEGVKIGDLKVHGVPVYETEAGAGVHVTLPSPEGGKPVEAPAACLSSPDWIYGGARWALRQGDRLQIAFSSTLDFRRSEVTAPVVGGISCRAANNHTHGLLVSPSRTVLPDGRTRYGDYVLDLAAPKDGPTGDPCAAPDNEAHDMAGMDMAGTGATRAMRVLPGGLDYDIRLPGRAGESRHGPDAHPSGLFWFHPHPHGYGALLTGGATTGMITVGSLEDYACPSGGGPACAAGTVFTRDMLLKDAEVAPDHGGWRLSYDRDYDLEDACATGRSDERRGQCSDWKGHRWLFTVNGVRYPVIGDAHPGRTEVWRIVNASPNVTYRLRLRPIGATPGEPLPLQVLSLEGAAPETRDRAQPGRQTEVLLMPAARAEIAVAPPAAGGVYVLEQQGFASGGDVWPAIALAEVRFPAAAPGARAPVTLEFHGAPTAPEPAARYYSAASMPGCGFQEGEVRHIYFVKRPSFADERRRKDTFGLVAAVQRPGQAVAMVEDSGAEVPLDAKNWQALLHADPHAPAFGHNHFDGVCTVLGHTESWVLENDTDEAHNFHIHQSEFQLALDRRADPDFFSKPAGAGVDPLLNASDRAVQAADGAGREPDEALLYHDTIPVPRGVSLGGRGCDGSPMNRNCRPGRVTIRIRFDRQEQVGTFLYHCHILQHEDEGMMALVRVLCPPGDAACTSKTTGG